MEYRSLGRTGIQVSPLCLGAMMFGGWGEPDHETSITTIHAALDGGINFIDTADVYSQGESEIIVGKALAGGTRDDVVLLPHLGSATREARRRMGEIALENAVRVVTGAAPLTPAQRAGMLNRSAGGPTTLGWTRSICATIV